MTQIDPLNKGYSSFILCILKSVSVYAYNMSDFEYEKYVPISKVNGTLNPMGSLNWHNKITTSFNLIAFLPFLI